MIEVKNLTKRYGDKLAVDGLSFSVRPGVVTGLLGPNGSGKSTTMRMIMGLDIPSGGRATINGQTYDQLRWPLRQVGALLEAKAIHPGRSAFNHLWMLAQTNDIPRSRVHEVLDVVGLSDVAGKRAGQFSLGMGQRLGIAAALLGDPPVLMFDEPINGLDPDGILWARNLLKSLAAGGRAVFVSSHLMSEMALTADHLVVIGRGTLVAEMPMTEFITQNSRQFVRVRAAAADVLARALDDAGASVASEPDGMMQVTDMPAAEIGELAARQHVTLHELAPQMASLEDAYMRLTHSAVEYRGIGLPDADSGAPANDLQEAAVR